jgi:hypothetical protein
MEASDIRELSQQARIDGKRLFGVSEFLYKFAIIVNWIIAIFGVFTVIGLMSQGGFGYLAAFMAAVIATFICVLNYMLAVLSTHIAKVLVHTSLACVALVEKNN